MQCIVSIIQLCAMYNEYKYMYDMYNVLIAFM